MNIRNKATAIRLLDFRSAPMRAFHMTWLAFFLCFFGWFGIAPLMPVIRQELHLTKEQIGNSIIASVAITVLARLLIGWLCDRVGPRRAYTWLLILGSLPVMGVGLSRRLRTFLLFRLAIGAIGASFVITQFHTSVMFAPNIVGSANATAAGWGNLGGGVTQMAMPLLFSGFLSLGAGAWWGWRLAMIVPGAALFLMVSPTTSSHTIRPMATSASCARRDSWPNARPPTAPFGKRAAIRESGRWPCCTLPASAWN